METWKPRLERRISEMAALIGAPEWFRYRFDASPALPGGDHKISVWSNGYCVEFMQGHPCDFHFERYDTEDEMLYALFKSVAQMMSWRRAAELLGLISHEWQEKYLAEQTRAKSKPE